MEGRTGSWQKECLLDAEELSSVKLDILLEVRVVDAVLVPSKGSELAVNVGVGHGLAVGHVGPESRTLKGLSASSYTNLL